MKESLCQLLAQTPFIAHPLLKNPHAQTIMGSLIPRRFRLVRENSKPRFFDAAPGVRVQGLCSWQENRTQKPVLLMVHGMEGSVDSGYMRGTAEKALAMGFSVVRMNLRGCGGTAHLTPTIYHAGLTDDLRCVIQELIEQDGLTEIYLVGFSLGGNVSLKLMGEYGGLVPKEVRGLIAVSPSIDLASCVSAIEMRSNLLYHARFLLSLRASLKDKARFFPNMYTTSTLRGIWSLRQFDSIITAPSAGFTSVDDYYRLSSALPVMSHIRVPTLIIHAKDDPFVPFSPFERPELIENPNITLLATKNGGHVGFISATVGDHFWSETIIVNFVKLFHLNK